MLKSLERKTEANEILKLQIAVDFWCMSFFSLNVNFEFSSREIRLRTVPF